MSSRDNISSPESVDNNGGGATNLHSLNVFTDLANRQQVDESFRKAINEASRILKRDIPCHYRVNLVTKRDGTTCGFAFVWVTNPEVYHILTGKNPDGTERFEKRPDPDWKPPEKKVEDPLKMPACWADLDMEDPEPPTIKVQLPPIVTLPPFEYNKEQFEIAKNKKIEEEKDNKDFDKDTFEFEKIGTFEAKASFVLPSRLEETYSSNVLRAEVRADWITQKIIEDYFRPYGWNRVSMSKPRDQKRAVYVTFNDDSTDAMFALQMTKKTVISDGRRSAVLIFNHAQKPKVSIYILALHGDRFYVGTTTNPRFRMENHFDNQEPSWTKVHRPARLHKLIPNCIWEDVDKYTLTYMSKYGIDNVRGGSFIDTHLTNIVEIKKTLDSEQCYICGETEHKAKDCSFWNEE